MSGRTKTIRKDYDIALIRLDYPIIDENSGDQCIIPSRDLMVTVKV